MQMRGHGLQIRRVASRRYFRPRRFRDELAAEDNSFIRARQSAVGIRYSGIPPARTGSDRDRPLHFSVTMPGPHLMDPMDLHGLPFVERAGGVQAPVLNVTLKSQPRFVFSMPIERAFGALTTPAGNESR